MGSIRSKRLLAFILLSAVGAHGTAAAGKNSSSVDVGEIIRKALDNFKAREAAALSYTYVEHDRTAIGRFAPKTDSYELIPLGNVWYRRHLQHNDKPLPADEEENEAKRLEEAKRNMQHTVEGDDPSVAQKKPGVQVRAGIVFKGGWEALQLDLQPVGDIFAFHLEREARIDGHPVYVLKGKPRNSVALSLHHGLNLKKLDLKLWIDESQMEILKCEGRVRETVQLMQPYYAVVNPAGVRGSTAKKEEDSLYESTFGLARGTVITWEWRKTNNEVWLPTRRQLKGDGAIQLSLDRGMSHEEEVPMDVETTYSDYQKFRVTHRILPDLKEPPSPNQ